MLFKLDNYYFKKNFSNMFVKITNSKMNIYFIDYNTMKIDL